VNVEVSHAYIEITYLEKERKEFSIGVDISVQL